MQYFYSNDGAAQQGPVEREQLIAAGVTRDSMVWREGMAQWTRAGDVPELADLFGSQMVAPAVPTGPYPADTIYQPQYATQMPPTSGFAIASLVLGIVGLFCCTMGVVSILAVIFGHLAKSEVRKGMKSGEGMATAGLVMGYISIVMGVLWWAFVLFNGTMNHGSSTFTPPVTSSRNLSHP